MPDKPTHNPYAQAANTYDQHAQKHTPSQRELEARVLLKATKYLQDLKKDWESADRDIIQKTLEYNRQIWMMFYDTALENPDNDRPDTLRSNIINLANFIFKTEIEILTNPAKDKLDILMDINREIAAGLSIKTEEEIKSDEQKVSQNQNNAPAKSTDIVS